MSVAVVVPSFGVGGCEMYAADLARELGRVVPTRLICQAPIQAALRRLAGAAAVTGVGPAESGASFAAAVDGCLSSFVPENLVVVTPLPVEEAGTTPDPVAALEVADARGIPTTAIFQLCHKVFDASAAARRAAERLTQIQGWVTVSHDNRSHLASTFRVPADRLAVIPNGVALRQRNEDEHRRGLRSELGLTHDAFVVLNVGRLVASKRQADAIIAMALLADDVHLAIAGEGPERAALAARVTAAGLASRVTLLGHREDVPALLDDADAFVFPSVAEGASFALLEAMAAGLPIVVARCGSNAEIVRDGVDGYLHQPASAEDVASKLHRLVLDRVSSAALGRSARRRVEADYDRRTMVRDTLRLVLGHRDNAEAESA
jgi:glycosyltransferase involved in cell wall biosynthesis